MTDTVLVREPEITDALIAAHGLKPDEYGRILELIGRTPTLTELGIFSAMWNEHCSYKSSKKWLRTLPTSGPQVICGPGENAGVVDIGDGQALVFKMESHNHPSYIEPYQGAATGVGGILRDVFTMGARPIAAMNALSFGRPSHPRTRSVVRGVVEGIGGYGNCFGVPTVGGELRFHAAYDGNCLVNAFAAGLAEADAIFYSAASGVGMPVVYLGAKTGRDGVGGRDDGVGGVRRLDRREAADRAGGRPLHREAADGGLPRADGDGRGDLDPGHGGGRADLLGGRDGRQGRPRDPARPRPGAGARGGDDRLRDDAVGEPGADADGAPAGEGGGRAGGLRQVGPRLRGGGRDDRRGPLRRPPPRRGEGGPAAEGAVGRGAGVRPAVGADAGAGAGRGGSRAGAGGGAAEADGAARTSAAGPGCFRSTTRW